LKGKKEERNGSGRQGNKLGGVNMKQEREAHKLKHD
jgi:hypothetical protein